MNTVAPPSTGGCPVDYNAPSRGFTGEASPTGCPVSHEAAEFDPFGTRYQVDPAEALKWFRNKEPVFYSPKLDYWVVTRFDDIKAIWADHHTFASTNVLDPMVPRCPEAQEILQSYGFAMSRTLINETEPMRMIRRRMLKDSFAPEALQAQLPLMQRLTTQLVDRFIDRGHADLVQEMLWDLPLLVALHFLGVEDDDIPKLRRFTVAHTVNTWGKPTREQQIAVAQNLGQFWQFSSQILDRMRATPDGPGWMRLQVRLNREHPDIFTDSYLNSMMLAVIGAAHETTASSISNALRLLLSDGRAWEQMCENPALIPNAMEECLRFEGALVSWRRKATRTVVIGGVTIPEGANILAVTVAGNRDERHFENPDVLDLYRDNTADHFTFGYGAHQCLGKNIGRMEMCVIGEELVRRLPHMRLAPDQEFTFLPNLSFRAPDHIHVEWDPSRNPERRDPAILTGRRSFPVGAPQREAVVRLGRIRAITPDGAGVKRFEIEDARGRPLPNWSAGAHIELSVGGFERSYSLCGRPGGAYEIAVLREDAGRGGSRHVHDALQVGQELRFRGPKNHFRLEEDADDYILIAGGIGITPILAMADRLKALGKPYRIHYAGQSRRTMALLARLEGDHAGRLDLYPKDEGKRMDLTAATAAVGVGSRVYACGPDRLLTALEGLAQRWPEGVLQFEYFATGATVLDPEKEHGFDITLADSGITLPVPADKTVLDVLLEAGIDVPSDCREGLCGSCECKVLGGEIDHRDKVLTQQERAAGDRMLPCCSRAAGDTITLAL
ncbi:MAG: cytochrome P450 [Rhodobacter sp.]|nr:cytochrome P450 [Rhodobacter sp.]